MFDIVSFGSSFFRSSDFEETVYLPASVFWASSRCTLDVKSNVAAPSDRVAFLTGTVLRDPFRDGLHQFQAFF